MTPSTRTPVTICPTRFAEGYVPLQYAGSAEEIYETMPISFGTGMGVSVSQLVGHARWRRK